MSRDEYHVTPKDGEWQVKKAGASRASSKASTQQETKQQAKKFAKGQGKSQVYIHGRNGQVREESSYGSDPHPPEGLSGRKGAMKHVRPSPPYSLGGLSMTSDLDQKISDILENLDSAYDSDILETEDQIEYLKALLLASNRTALGEIEIELKKLNDKIEDLIDEIE